MQATTLDQNAFIGDLHHLIDRSCRPDEIQALCSGLGVDYDLLPGETKTLKANALVMYYAQRGRLIELLHFLREQRPQVAWPELPPDKQGFDNRPRVPIPSEQGKSTLRSYTAEMETLLQERNLRESRPNSEVRNLARTITLATLRRLNGNQKRELLTFLHELGLIKRENPLVDLRGADLTDSSLSWANLRQVNLAGADLSGADMSLANLRDSDLGGAILRGANLRAYLVNCDLVKADLREAEMMGGRLAGANLAGATMRVANLREADLTGANLTGADLTLANLEKANLTSASLIWTNFRQANLRGVIFRDVDLSMAELDGAEVPDDLLLRAISPSNGHLKNGKAR